MLLFLLFVSWESINAVCTLILALMVLICIRDWTVKYWIKNLLHELHVKFSKPLIMFCQYQAVMHIAKNPLYYERTKHIEVDC